MSFVCPKANSNPTGPTVFCQAEPLLCTEAADPGTYGPLRGTSKTCDGLVCTVHGCQRADGHAGHALANARSFSRSHEDVISALTGALT